MPSGTRLRVDDPEHPVTVVDGADNVRRATRELLRAGADQIKTMTSGGVLSPNDEPIRLSMPALATSPPPPNSPRPT